MAQVGSRRARRWWLALGAAALIAWALPVAAQRPREYQVKAAYLYGFGRFVEWPAAARIAADGTFVVCVLGEDPFGFLLDQAVEGGLMKNQPVSVRRIARVEDGSGCDTLFVSASERPRLPRILEALDRRPVLTVGDSPEFAQRGGMIGFSVEGSRVRFTVNLDAAQNAGLTLQSELLRVAAAVLRGR
jgi:uncharacterized protein DUF4154